MRNAAVSPHKARLIWAAFAVLAPLHPACGAQLGSVTGEGNASVCAVLVIAIAMVAGVATYLSHRSKSAAERELGRTKAQMKTASSAEEALKALSALEAQCLIVWNGGTPRLALHTLPGSPGVPAKLPQLLRFGAWLDASSAAVLTESLERLRKTGNSFRAIVSTAAGAGRTLECAGGVYGGDRVLRFREIPATDLEAAHLTAENEKLKGGLRDRDRLLDALPFPVWLRDGSDKLEWVNAAYAEAVQAKGREEVVRERVELFETRQRKELSKSAGRNASRIRLQTIVNGQVRLYEAVGAAFGTGTGGAALDVAPLATAEGELKRQIAAHGSTLNKVSTGIAIFGPDRKLVYFNEALASVWPLEGSALGAGLSASAFFDLLRQRRLLPEQSNYRKWRDEHILAWDRGGGLDELWHLPQGRSIKVLTDGRADGGVAFLFDDVTEKLALERQYHNLIEVQRETLDHLTEGIAVFGANGRLQLFNPALAAIWALPHDLLDRAPHLEDIIAHCNPAAPGAVLWQDARNGITSIGDARDSFSGTVERRDRSYIAYAGMPLPDGGTLLTFADITDSRRIEAVLLERSEALEAADRLKTAFLSHVSYELRTPLTSIIGFTDLLSAPEFGTLNAKQAEYLNDINRSSQVLLTIINDILDLAVIDAGALDLKLAPVSAKEIAEAAGLGVRERLARMKMSLDIHVSPDVDTVVADANRLTQVLYNLLSNAIGFSPEGGTITLACRKEKNGVSFSVQDTGLGIPEEAQAAVFERFETRSHGSRHRGAGLGLSLVKSIVELHSGRIDLRSSPGAGTTVTVFLPSLRPKLQPQPDKARRLALPQELPPV